MISGSRQNEILAMYSHAIVDKICDQARTTGAFAIILIVDGTLDISGKEQESICIRYGDDFEPHDEFIGMYEPSDTTGNTLTNSIQNILVRLILPLSVLRGQTFDGASNTSGAYNGRNAFTPEKQPFALRVHCRVHCYVCSIN